MPENSTVDRPRSRAGSWRVIAITVLITLLSTIGFAAAADSFNFQVRGGAGSGAVLKCPGGMDRLAHQFGEGITTVFPGDPLVTVNVPFQIDDIIPGTTDEYGYQIEEVFTGTHGGTHLDAPSHFIIGGRSIDDLDATEFVWPAYVIDVRERVRDESRDFQLERADIRDYERANGRIKQGSMVIIYTGHDAFFGTSDYTDLSHPGFSGAAVQWMFDSRSIAGVGSDGLGPDASSDAYFDATYTALLNDGLAMPGINNLDTMNAKGDIIMASAVPLADGSGFITDPLACHGNGAKDSDHSWDEGDDEDDDQGGNGNGNGNGQGGDT